MKQKIEDGFSKSPGIDFIPSPPQQSKQQYSNQQCLHNNTHNHSLREFNKFSIILNFSSDKYRIFSGFQALFSNYFYLLHRTMMTSMSADDVISVVQSESDTLGGGRESEGGKIEKFHQHPTSLHMREKDQ